MNSGGLPPVPEEIHLAAVVRRVDWGRIAIVLLGVLLFSVVYFCGAWTDAVDPSGVHFALTRAGKGSLALALLALTWWIGEVVPIGVTSIAVGVIQVLFLIRPARSALTDFMDPSVWFIIGSLVIGMVFTRTGLTQRVAYRMLLLVGERTKAIYLGCFATTALMTLVMAHTAVAAVIFPLLMAVYSLYPEDDKPTRFGKGLFIGMAFGAGAGSIVTLLGSARAPVALGFFKEMAGREISFLEMSYYMLPLGWGMAILLWIFCMIFFPPEKKTIPGLHERARALHSRLGPMSRNERLALVIVLLTVAALNLRSFVRVLQPLDQSAIILVSTVLFFLLRVLDLKDLEEIPWNIVLLFGGAMSLGLCLWQTGAASWLAVSCLVVFQGTHWLLFVLGAACFALVMTNVVLNVAVIAVCLPVALVIARYQGIAPEVILYPLLAAAGMPFLTLLGAAPNAIAYGSRQFSPGEFFAAGMPASVLLLLVLALFVSVIWPAMGMPLLAG